MNKATRMLTMMGMGLMAGATIGAAPALAADSNGTAASVKSSTAKVQKHDRGERVVGFYRNLRSCELAGRIGERFDRWEDYDCERVRFGFKRGLWALEVEQNWRGGHGHGPWGGGHGHGHGGHGHGGHGHGGHGHGR